MTRIRKMRAGTLAALTVPAIVGRYPYLAPAHATVGIRHIPQLTTAPNGLNSQYHVYVKRY